MNKDFILNTWIPALRNGTYKQARWTLNDGAGGYCCLGVACDLIDGQAWSDDRQEWRDCRYYLPFDTGRFIFGDVSHPDNPYIEVNGVLDQLSQHNDMNGATFEQIADGLEAWVHAHESAA